MTGPDTGLAAILAALAADEADEATYKLLTATHDDEEDRAILTEGKAHADLLPNEPNLWYS